MGKGLKNLEALLEESRTGGGEPGREPGVGREPGAAGPRGPGRPGLSSPDLLAHEEKVADSEEH